MSRCGALAALDQAQQRINDESARRTSFPPARRRRRRSSPVAPAPSPPEPPRIKLIRKNVHDTEKLSLKSQPRHLYASATTSAPSITPTPHPTLPAALSTTPVPAAPPALPVVLASAPTCKLPSFHTPPPPPVDAGRTCVAAIFCVPSVPEPHMTHWPMEGTPLMRTKRRTGPGERMAGFGGSWETCRVAEPDEEAVKVELL